MKRILLSLSLLVSYAYASSPALTSPEIAMNVGGETLNTLLDVAATSIVAESALKTWRFSVRGDMKTVMAIMALVKAAELTVNHSLNNITSDAHYYRQTLGNAGKKMVMGAAAYSLVRLVGGEDLLALKTAAMAVVLNKGREIAMGAINQWQKEGNE